MSSPRVPRCALLCTGWWHVRQHCHIVLEYTEARYMADTSNLTWESAESNKSCNFLRFACTSVIYLHFITKAAVPVPSSTQYGSEVVSGCHHPAPRRSSVDLEAPYPHLNKCLWVVAWTIYWAAAGALTREHVNGICLAGAKYSNQSCVRYLHCFGEKGVQTIIAMLIHVKT